MREILSLFVFIFGIHAAAQNLNQIFSSYAKRGAQISAINSPNLTRLTDQYTGKNLIELQKSSFQSSVGNNERTFSALQEIADKGNLSKGNCYTDSELNNLFQQKIKNQSVIRNQKAYDPNRVIGFCFGRALIAHLKSVELKPGVPVLKIWTVGALSAGSIHWSFHTSAMVLACNRKWYALDTLFNKPASLAEWIAKTKNYYHASPQNFIVVTRAEQFHVDGKTYATEKFKPAYFGNYFTDFLKNNPGIAN